MTTVASIKLRPFLLTCVLLSQLKSHCSYLSPFILIVSPLFLASWSPEHFSYSFCFHFSSLSLPVKPWRHLRRRKCVRFPRRFDGTLRSHLFAKCLGHRSEILNNRWRKCESRGEWKKQKLHRLRIELCSKRPLLWLGF